MAREGASGDWGEWQGKGFRGQAGCGRGKRRGQKPVASQQAVQSGP